MSSTAHAILLAIFTLASCIWVGGYVAIAVVARVATHTLAAGQRVAFFRGLGRSYLLIGVSALVIALGTGAALVHDHQWDATLIAAAAVAAALVATLALAVVQARRMTRLRAGAVNRPDDAELAGRVRLGARMAAAIRAIIGLLNLALIALGSVLAT